MLIEPYFDITQVASSATDSPQSRRSSTLPSSQVDARHLQSCLAGSCSPTALPEPLAPLNLRALRLGWTICQGHGDWYCFLDPICESENCGKYGHLRG